MSKSLGNFFTLRQLLDQGFSGYELRYMLLQSHYRTQFNFTKDGLFACRQSLKRLRDFISRLEYPYPLGDFVSPKATNCGEEFVHAFTESLANDLNIASALAALFDFVHQINSLIDAGNFTKTDAHYILDIINKINHVLGILPSSTHLDVPEHILHLVKERESARQKKNWEKADNLRQQIAALGYSIEDAKSGPQLKKL